MENSDDWSMYNACVCVCVCVCVCACVRVYKHVMNKLMIMIIIIVYACVAMHCLVTHLDPSTLCELATGMLMLLFLYQQCYKVMNILSEAVMKQVLMFCHLNNRRCVNTVHMYNYW